MPHLASFVDGFADWAGAISDTVQAIAVLVAGLWTYLHFIRGRTFTNRLDLSLSVEKVRSGSKLYLKLALKAANTGRSKISFDRENSVIYIYQGVRRKLPIDEVHWGKDKRTAFPMLTDHSWVEAGEAIVEERLFSVDSSSRLFRIEVVCRTGKQKRTATCTTVLTEDDYGSDQAEKVTRGPSGHSRRVARGSQGGSGGPGGKEETGAGERTG